MSRKVLEQQARQRFILDAARELFAEKGIDTTSMEDIAAAADYTRRTLYTYFASRDDILLRVLIEDLHIRWAAQQEAMKMADTGLDKILGWGRAFFEYAKENPQSMRLQYFWDFKGVDRKSVSSEVFRSFEAINDDLAGGLRTIFRLGVKDGSLRPDLKIDMTISQYLYSLRAILNRAVSPTYSFAYFEPDDYVEHFLDLFTRSIKNPKRKMR